MYDRLPDVDDWGQYACENFASKLPKKSAEEFVDHMENLARDFVFNDQAITILGLNETIKEGLVQLLTLFGHMCVLTFMNSLVKENIEEEE